MGKHTVRTTQETPTNPPKLVTISRAAQIMAISERSAWRLVSTGELETIKLGRSTRVKVESIDRLIERGGAA